jgi:thymidine phosphorylase
VCHVKRGDSVSAGDVLAEVHARDDASASTAADSVLAAYALGSELPHPHGILLDVVA